MNLSDVAWLSSDEGRAVLAELPPYRADEVLTITGRLRSDGVSAEHAAVALTQCRLRDRAARRWGPGWADTANRMLFTSSGAEQTTRPAVAALRAERFTHLEPGSRVADVGCGIGTDTVALAQLGLRVDAFEQDPVTAAVAAANFRALALESEPSVTIADVRSLPEGAWAPYHAVFADPARRTDGRRITDPERWSPRLSWVQSLSAENLGVKVAPGLDRSLAPEGTEFAVVSDRGEVVEAGLYRGVLRESGVTRSATLLPEHLKVTDRDLPQTPARVRTVGRYIHEPDPAVIRSGLVTAVADQLGCWLIDPQIAYLSGDDSVSSRFVSSYQVHAVMPFSLKALRAHLRENDVGHVVVKKRGSAVDVDELRQSLRLRGAASGHRTVLLSRVGHRPIAIVTTPTK
ncbi:MAG: THUMP-like domain-containing protein [Actinomycetes bacterium]